MNWLGRPPQQPHPHTQDNWPSNRICSPCYLRPVLLRTTRYRHHQHPSQADAYRMLVSSLDPVSYPPAPSNSWTVLLTQGLEVPCGGQHARLHLIPYVAWSCPPVPSCFLLSWLRTSARSLTYKFRLPSLVPGVPHRSFCIHLTIRFPINA